MDIVIITGSNRPDAVSTRIAGQVEQLTQKRGHRTIRFDLYRRPLPFFSPDDREPPRPEVAEFRQAVAEADAIVLATPEYHGSFSGTLKNALDHLVPDHFSGKAVLSVSAAGGRLGFGSLQQLQAVVRALHGINAPEWISVGGDEPADWESDSADGPGSESAIRQRIVRATEVFLELAAKVRPQASF